MEAVENLMLLLQKEGNKMDIKGLFKSACGAVAKVAKAVVNTVTNAVKSVISGVSGLFKAASGALETAVSKAKDMAEELDFDGDGHIDVDEDFEEILEEEFKLLVGALLSDELVEDPDGTGERFENSIKNWLKDPINKTPELINNIGEFLKFSRDKIPILENDVGEWLTDPKDKMFQFENNIDELKRNDTAGNIIKRTDTFKWFRKKTQEGDFPELFDIGGFDRDENGVYHAQQDALQQYGGYTDLYDDVFDLACSMDKQKFDFSVDGDDYIVWLWKGDYLNLGVGAETGIYKGGEPLWECDTNDAMPMTLRVEDTSGNVIYDWKPEENKWWCTGFNPAYEDYNVKDLISIGTIDFSQHTYMWENFKESCKKRNRNIWDFDDENYIATYKWK
ncbi:DUF4474 domain-containing protein [Clostridium botulinum]|uniref:DUF4474 domain-containing protein n=2 Tax=Clostridium botulinum TaxID=1491 RepID=A0A6B4JLL6_CLOBO|nr:DUF4474 domain-containing protein [Clostridium botulinum]NFJ57810.1 DUF4474 domain-containing protein [Clostridium botulinum]NFL38526.1 DUF4474 domain-containing protein [Clostridium botulinum]NFL51271.1 DUF4474 domain-containing protein [Clostridium botulinum]NFL64849.1 DUF4474 domain-containing protein [Clostridium botulinum]